MDLGGYSLVPAKPGRAQIDRAGEYLSNLSAKLGILVTWIFGWDTPR